jgi:hypothetical protein
MSLGGQAEKRVVEIHFKMRKMLQNLLGEKALKLFTKNILMTVQNVLTVSANLEHKEHVLQVDMSCNLVV